MLDGKRILVTGVATNKSIAYAIARQVQEAGAAVALTSFGRMRSITERSARGLPQAVPVIELDVNNPDDLAALPDAVVGELGGLDGAVHAIAWAPEDAFGGQFMRTPSHSAVEAFLTSAFSLKALAQALSPLLVQRRSGSIIGLDFDASAAWPIYDWMGVCKAALESIARYLARDLGPDGVRVNLIASGPIGTPTATSIPGFREFTGFWSYQAPLGWDTADPSPIAKAACFLLSDWASAVTGEILHVDGGYHAMAAPLRDPTEQPPVPGAATQSAPA